MKLDPLVTVARTQNQHSAHRHQKPEEPEFEDKVDGNPPRVLFCGHYFCTFCLLSIQSDGAIRCPDCEIESTLPEGGVCGLQEEPRIIGLIYTAKINKMKRLRFSKAKNSRKNRFSPCGDHNMMDKEMPPGKEKIEKVVDEALTQSTRNLAQLEHIHETLKAGLAERVEGERRRLEVDINQATERASQAILKWKEMQLSQLVQLEARFSRSQAVVSHVQERIKNLEIAMQMAREVCRVPFLGQYCILDKVLETLQAPVDDSFDMECMTMDSEISCVFRSESLSHSLTLSLKMEAPSPKRLTGSSAKDYLLEGSDKKCPLTKGGGSSSTQWVVVTHIVNPSHFYVRYVAEGSEREDLSKKINQLCFGDGCCFVTGDTVENGHLIFVKWKGGMWCRSKVIEVFQKGCEEAVNVCLVLELASLQVFFLDFGFTKICPCMAFFSSEDSTTESTLKAVNKHLRKVKKAVNVKLCSIPPQAIRCAFKDLVPYDLTKGWSKEAEVEFYKVVDSAAVEMRPLGQDGDSLLVDLRKAPTEQSTDVAISIREFLVFIEVARFYSPVTPTWRPLMYYPPVYPKINTELNAMVSHINSPSDFYIQVVDNKEFSLLSTKLQNCYNAPAPFKEDELLVYCPVLGQACIALFEETFWYRAKVIGHSGGRQVEVQYVDFGNKKILSVSNLRKITDEFIALPAMAINCCLADVLPPNGETWSETCTNRFISLTLQQLVTVVATGIVSNTEPLPIKVLKSGSNELQENIAELLVKEDLACFKDGLKYRNAKPSCDDFTIWDPPLDLDSTSEVVNTQDQIFSGDQDDQSLELQPQLKLPDQLKDLKVRVSYVSSPSSFYVQFTQYDDQFRRICELVKKECASEEPQDVVWKADMYCAAHINGVWERGQICSDVTSSNLAEVRRCDHGNTVKVHVSNLRPLPPSLIGSLVLECTLSDIRPTGGRSTWTDTACDLISLYLTRASAVMSIKEMTDQRPVPVTLLCSNKMGQFISIADFLINEGLALRERTPKDAGVQEPEKGDSQTPASDHHNDSKKENTAPSLVKTPPYHPPELPCLGHLQINVSTVGEDGLIYVRAQNAEYQLEQLREMIQQSMKTLPRQKSFTWKSVQGCAVIGPDMQWYRGQLLEVLGVHVKVQYVDYGLVENIPVVHVYPVLLCVDVPQLCLPCQLLGIHPVGGTWQRDAVALMKELLVNRSLDMQVVELPADPRGPLTVELFLDGLSVSRILCHHEHASVDRTAQKVLTVKPPEPLLDDWDFDAEGLRSPEEPLPGPFIYPDLPQEGEQFKVMVKHLWTPNELFVWPLENAADVEVDGETLDEALTRINADINTLPRLTSFLLGGPCLAEYSDGKYYRASLQSFCSTEPVMILVQHVDFGSDDTLPTSKLRQMPAELLQFPCQALKVKVAGFKAPITNRYKDVLPYSPGWSTKAVSDMIELLHGNITAAVVAREPELTVLLYGEDGELVHLSLVESGLAELD
ncbi:RING finger protein 17 [Xenentodon cancila]